MAQNLTKKQIYSLIESLSEARRISKMETCNFSRIVPNKDDQIPTNENEVTPFIKKRIYMWMESWIGDPLDEAIKVLKRSVNDD